MKKYICIKGSPEIPKGSEAIEITHETRELPYNIQCEGKHIIYLFRNSVEQNPECWEEVKEETEERGRCRLNKGDTYWSIQEGCIVDKTEMKIYNDKWLFEQGNYFYTPQEAEAELMRMKSRAGRWDFVPKDGEWYYMWELSNEEVYKYKWSITNNDYNQWNMGNCHRTKEDARKWCETYAQYFLHPQN